MNAAQRHELRRCICSLAFALATIGQSENAEILGRVPIDSLPTWVEGSFGAQVWAEIAGGLKTAEALMSPTSALARAVVFAVAAQESADKIMVAARPCRVLRTSTSTPPRAA